MVDSSTPKTASSSTDDIAVKQTPTNRYNLDSVIESEGANLSVGERSLLSLARALVKDCKVVVLDEATLVMYFPPGRVMSTFSFFQSLC